MTRHLTRWMAIILCAGGGIQAERRPLDPPPLVHFRPENHFSEGYRQALSDLGQLLEESDCASARRTHGNFYETLNQARLLETARELRERLDQCAAAKPASQSEASRNEKLLEALDRVSELIRAPDYIRGGGYPIEITVNEKERHYEVRWQTWTGAAWDDPYVVRKIPFVPRIKITVFARYDSTADGGSYGYEVQNGKESEAPVPELWIEALGLTDERLDSLNRGYYGYTVLDDGTMFNLRLPGKGYLQDFQLRLFDKTSKNWMTKSAKPGENLNFPALLHVPWKQLPGLVTCWASPADYQSGLSAESDPETARYLFHRIKRVSTPNRHLKKVHLDWYKGKTIGPVPAPGTEVSSGQFLETIRGYFQQAQEWGWCPNQTTAKAIERDFQKLAAGKIQREELLQLVKNVEAAYRRKELLEEAYVVLKFNLEYLAMNKIPQ